MAAMQVFEWVDAEHRSNSGWAQCEQAEADLLFYYKRQAGNGGERHGSMDGWVEGRIDN